MAIEELAEGLAEEVATNLEEAAEVTRKLNTVGLSYFTVGLGVGVLVGFYFGHKFNREKIKAEAFEEAEKEVSQIREMYVQKTIALDNIDKPPVEEMVEGLGYRPTISEGQAVDYRRPLRPPVPISEVPADALDDLPEEPKPTSKSMNAGWNQEEERRNRTPDAPYIIHQNEYFHSEPEYHKAVFTFWEIDDVIADAEDNQLITDPLDVVGAANLRFGHGSDDTDVVFIRNDELNLDIQLVRVNKSYEEEILGLDGSSSDDDDDDDDDT